jgi:hypothetical protein
MLSTTSPVTAPPKIRVIHAAGQPSSCRPTTDRGCKRPFKEPPLTAESGGATRAALLAMRAHRGTGSSNPLPSSSESANFRSLPTSSGKARNLARNRKFESSSLQQTVRLSPDFAFVPGKARVLRRCGDEAGQHGRQRRARSSSIALRSGSVSIGRYFSTAASPMRFAPVGAPPPSAVAPLEMQQYRKSLEPGSAQAKPSTVR